MVSPRPSPRSAGRSRTGGTSSSCAKNIPPATSTTPCGNRTTCPKPAGDDPIDEVDTLCQRAWRARSSSLPQTMEDIYNRNGAVFNGGAYLKPSGRNHVAHFTPGRATKRVPGKKITDVFLPRDREDFDFSKIRDLEKELLLVGRSVQELQDPFFHHLDDLCVGENTNSNTNSSKNAAGVYTSYDPRNVHVLGNLHPIAPGHILLLPPGLHEQFLTADSLKTALEFARRTKKMQLTWNSLGAGASVNHAHWQGSPFPAEFPIEQYERKVARKLQPAVEVCRVPGWPLRSLLEVRLDEKAAATTSTTSPRRGEKMFVENNHQQLHGVVFALAERLQSRNITFNVTVFPGATRATIAAREFYTAQSFDPKAMAVASLESLGHWIIVDEDNYNNIADAEGKNLDALLDSLSIPEDVLQEVMDEAFGNLAPAELVVVQQPPEK